MLQSINLMRGNKLGASDGEIGHVKDFYFDDKHWAVRYLVVDTGSWLFERSVLISPHAFTELYQPGKLMLVNLTRRQIEESPSMDAHQPVTRQYEETYLGYYGWPYYWMGNGVWGMSSFPITTMPLTTSTPLPDEADRHRMHVDAHLQSTLDISRFDVLVEDDKNGDSVGKVVDFLMDDQDWAIRNLVIKTGEWASEKTLLLSTDQVARIDTTNAQLHMKLSREDILQATVYKETAAVA